VHASDNTQIYEASHREPGEGPSRTQPPQSPGRLTLKGQTANKCSSEVQQPHRTEPTASDSHRPADLRQRPSVTFLPLNGKEEVLVSVYPRWVWQGHSNGPSGTGLRNLRITKCAVTSRYVPALNVFNVLGDQNLHIFPDHTIFASTSGGCSQCPARAI